MNFSRRMDRSTSDWKTFEQNVAGILSTSTTVMVSMVTSWLHSGRFLCELKSNLICSGEQDPQELSAPSGKALIYFFSDLAMNLDGFNITYEFEK